MSSPPSFSSIVRFVVFFLCDESRDVIRMHKSESHLARTQKPSLMQVVPLHLFCSQALLSSLFGVTTTLLFSSCFTPHIYITLPEILLKRKSTNIIQFVKWMKKNLLLHSHCTSSSAFRVSRLFSSSIKSRNRW